MAAQLGITLSALGLKPDTFGHMVITNVGPMGFTSAYAPLCPPLHSIALMCTGTIEKRTYVDTKDDDKIKVANMMTGVATGDHRYGDAAIMRPFFVTFKGFLENPPEFDETKYKDMPHHSELKSQ